MAQTPPTDPNAPPEPPSGWKDHEPYCSNCGYVLTDLTDSSKCPECGRPLVEVLTRAPRMSEGGKRFRSEATMFGLPIVDVAFGPKLTAGETKGKARGIIAVGDDAFGFIAIGGSARGIVSVGGGSIGVFSMGGGSIGLITSIGGGSVGGFAVGGAAVGGIAAGGGEFGFIAQGGGEFGYYARGGGASGVHTWGPGGAGAEAQQMFTKMSPVLGQGLAGPSILFQPFMTIIGIMVVATLVILAMAWRGNRKFHRAKNAVEERPFGPD